MKPSNQKTFSVPVMRATTCSKLWWERQMTPKRKQVLALLKGMVNSCFLNSYLENGPCHRKGSTVSQGPLNQTRYLSVLKNSLKDVY